MRAVCKKLYSITHPNGFAIAGHTHADHELVYCIEGRGSVVIGNQRYNFSTGNYYITRRGSLHTEEDESTTKIIYFYFDAPGELVRDGMYTDFDGAVLSSVKHLQKELELDEPYRDEMVSSLMIRMLIKSLRSEEGRRTRDSMQQAVRYIDENIRQDIDMHALARRYHYSLDRFRHLFKDYTGLSPHQYIIKGRIEQAKFLLELNPNTSLTEISYNCGFSSSSHFTKAFRSKVGMTPSSYARIIASQGD